MIRVEKIVVVQEIEIVTLCLRQAEVARAAPADIFASGKISQR